MKKLLLLVAIWVAFIGDVFCLIEIGVFEPGTYGSNPSGAVLEIAIKPQSTYPALPAAAEFNVIISIPTTSVLGTEAFAVVENNVNNGNMGWDNTQTFDHNGNRYYVFTYSGTGIDLSLFGSGDFTLAFTITAAGISPGIAYTIADINSGIFTDFSIRSSLNLLGVNQLVDIATPATLDNTALPVELISFTADKRKKGTLLEWKIANEVDLDKYVLSRSPDAQHFLEIKEVKANNVASYVYEYLDSEVIQSGTYYYRLKMVDIDSSFSESELVSVFYDNEVLITVAPNPTSDFVRISTNGIIEKNSFYIIDSSGVKIFSGILGEADQITIDTSKWGSGKYFLCIMQDNHNHEYIQFVVSK